jgi:hypothetical protein
VTGGTNGATIVNLRQGSNMSNLLREGDSMHEGSAHTTIIAAANAAIPTGLFITGVGWVSSTVLLGLMGVVVTSVFGCVGVYYRWKDDRRKDIAVKAKISFYKWHKDNHITELPEENDNVDRN